MLIASAVVFPVLRVVPAPYGRHARKGWGPSVSARLGWMVMESPSVWLIVWAFWNLSPFHDQPQAAWVLIPWLIHYLQRTLVFPFLLKAPRPMPVVTVAMALVFNFFNAIGNGAALEPRGLSLKVVLGLAIWAVGLVINLRADAALRGLRKQAGEYPLPRGGLFEWVSCPNYLGECLEWLGFALIASTLASFALFVFTVANLLPRALTHHRWYRQKFPDYPPQRKAMIPFLL